MTTPRSLCKTSNGGGLPVTVSPAREGASKMGGQRRRLLCIVSTLAIGGALMMLASSSGLGAASQASPSRTGTRSSRKLLDAAEVPLPSPPSFLPGQPWFDSDGNIIQAHGGSALRTPDGTYWWYGEDKSGKSYESKPGGHWRVDTVGVAAYWSRDLVSWHRSPKLALAAVNEIPDLHPKNSILERPKVVYNAKTKKYVMWMHIDSIDYGAAKLGVAVSDTPAGPFKYLRSLRPNNNQESRDMTIFVDEVGRPSKKDPKRTEGKGDAYVAYSSEMNKVLHISRLTDDYLDLRPISKNNNYTRVAVGLSREAPAIFQAHGAYFLLTSGCTGWDANAAEVFVADHPLSQNWTSLGAPMSGSTPAAREKTFYSQPAFVVPAPGGPEGAFVYMGDAWNKEDLGNSRYVWLPLWVFPPEKGVVIDSATGKPLTTVPIPGAAAALASAADATASTVVSTASIESEADRKERLEKAEADRAKMSADDRAKAAARERATALAAAAQHGASHAVVLQWADSWHPQDLKGSPPRRPRIVEGRVVDVDN